jgi:hypothetical protein
MFTSSPFIHLKLPTSFGLEGQRCLVYFCTIILHSLCAESLLKIVNLSLHALSPALRCYVFCFDKSTEFKSVPSCLVDMFEPICAQ